MNSKLSVFANNENLAVNLGLASANAVQSLYGAKGVENIFHKVKELHENIKFDDLVKNSVVTNDNFVPRDIYEYLNPVIREASEETQRVLGPMGSLGLLTSRPGGLGVKKVTDEREGLLDEAGFNMEVQPQQDNNRLGYDEQSAAVPVASIDFSIGVRDMESFQDVATRHTMKATRKILKLKESAIFNGAPNIKHDGATVYGLRTFPDRNTALLTGSWNSLTGDQVLADVQAGIEVLTNKDKEGPYVLLIPVQYRKKLQEDFKANGDKILSQRITELDDVSAIIWTKRLADDEIVLMQAATNVFEIVDTVGITVVPWQVHPGLLHFKVMSAFTIFPKSDKPEGSANPNCGIYHATAP